MLAADHGRFRGVLLPRPADLRLCRDRLHLPCSWRPTAGLALRDAARRRPGAGFAVQPLARRLDPPDSASDPRDAHHHRRSPQRRGERGRPRPAARSRRATPLATGWRHRRAGPTPSCSARQPSSRTRSAAHRPTRRPDGFPDVFGAVAYSGLLPPAVFRDLAAATRPVAAAGPRPSIAAGSRAAIPSRHRRRPPGRADRITPPRTPGTRPSNRLITNRWSLGRVALIFSRHAFS